MAIERIAVTDLQKKLDSSNKPIVVDVRDASEIKESGAIPGAVHIPIKQIETRLDELPKDAEIVTYCGGGGRASRAAEALAKAGYKNVQYCGLREWKKEGLPTTPTIK